MRPYLDPKVRHGGFVPSLWVTHRPRYEVAAHVPRVQALEAVFAKCNSYFILERKRSHVLLDDVAFHCERPVGVAQMKRFAKRCTRELKLVQLKGQ